MLKTTVLRITNRQLWLINPHYQVKFGLSPRKLNKVIAYIPILRNVFSTSCFYILKKKEHKLCSIFSYGIHGFR